MVTVFPEFRASNSDRVSLRRETNPPDTSIGEAVAVVVVSVVEVVFSDDSSSEPAGASEQPPNSNMADKIEAVNPAVQRFISFSPFYILAFC